MLSNRIILSGFVAALMFTGTGMAQNWAQTQNAHGYNPSPGVPRATQRKRCENLGLFVEKAAIARDQHESENHFMNRAGRSVQESLSITTLIRQVFNGTETPGAWEHRMQGECEKNIS